LQYQEQVETKRFAPLILSKKNHLRSSLLSRSSSAQSRIQQLTLTAPEAGNAETRSSSNQLKRRIAYVAFHSKMAYCPGVQFGMSLTDIASRRQYTRVLPKLHA